MQDIQRQLDALNELKSFLRTFMYDLRVGKESYYNKFQGLRESRLPVQISNNYEANFWLPNTQRLDALLAKIENEDLQFINRNIAQLEQALATATGSEQ